MYDITAVLQAAIDGGEIVTIVYNGGSRHGQPRTIIPLSILEDCLVAKDPPPLQLRKTYNLSKVAISFDDGEYFIEREGKMKESAPDAAALGIAPHEAKAELMLKMAQADIESLNGMEE